MKTRLTTLSVDEIGCFSRTMSTPLVNNYKRSLMNFRIGSICGGKHASYSNRRRASSSKRRRL